MRAVPGLARLGARELREICADKTIFLVTSRAEEFVPRVCEYKRLATSQSDQHATFV